MTITVYDTPIVPESGDSGRRRSEEAAYDPSLPSSRILRDEGTCFCGSETVGQRAPLEAEFIEAYALAVGNRTSECVSSVGECDFFSQFETDLVLSIFQRANISAALDAIGDTFLETANAVLATDPEKCNIFKQIILKIETRLGMSSLYGAVSASASASMTLRLAPITAGSRSHMTLRSLSNSSSFETTSGAS